MAGLVPWTRWKNPGLAPRLRELSEAQGTADVEPFKSFVEQLEQLEQLETGDASERKNREETLGRAIYARLWTRIRESGLESYNHVSRYWVRSATYEGMSVALLLWVIATGHLAFSMDPIDVAERVTLGVLALLCFAASVACQHEAERITLSLNEEVVAAVAEDDRLKRARTEVVTVTSETSATSATSTTTSVEGEATSEVAVTGPTRTVETTETTTPVA